MKRLLFKLIFVITLLSPAALDAQVLDSTHKNWNVFTINQDGKKICYIASLPKSKKGNYKRRDEPYFLVTHRGNKQDEVSTSSGYPYNQKKDVEVTIDGKKYKLFTKGELAWAPDSKQDNDMVVDMRKGNRMTVKGYSRLGTYSIDTYSLAGVTAAHKRMKALCK